MKKLFLLGVLCFGLLLPFGVSAEENSTSFDSVEEGQNNEDISITVGDVAVPVYSVYLSWDAQSFDWVYNEETKKFGWGQKARCESIGTDQETVEANINAGLDIYQNAECTMPASMYHGEMEYYYLIPQTDKLNIYIEDYSENGQITPSIEWTSDEKYSDVDANFQYLGETCALIETEEIYQELKEHELKIFSNSICTVEADKTAEFDTGEYYVYAYKNLDLTTTEVPENGRHGAAGIMIGDLIFTEGSVRYNIVVRLTSGTTTPTTGDTIGTITITIKAYE